MSFKNPQTYVIFALFGISLILSSLVWTQQHFVLLARSFLEGSLAFTQVPQDISDLSFYSGKYYWPLGPFPAIIAMPFAYFFKYFIQGYISLPLTILNFYLLVKIAAKMGLDTKRKYLAAIF